MKIIHISIIIIFVLYCNFDIEFVIIDFFKALTSLTLGSSMMWGHISTCKLNIQSRN